MALMGVVSPPDPPIPPMVIDPAKGPGLGPPWPMPPGPGLPPAAATAAAPAIDASAAWA